MGRHREISNVIGIDDAPFDRAWRGDVPMFGTIYAGVRLEGVVRGAIRRDGRNATARIARLAGTCRFGPGLQAVLLQGIALGGFNVVDIHALNEAIALPVVVVARRRPDLAAIRAALLTKVPGGARKWALVERAGPMEKAAGVYSDGHSF